MSHSSAEENDTKIINQAKFENDCISRNGHRIKITQPNLMILVSFSSAENALSVRGDDIINSLTCIFISTGQEMFLENL